MLMYFHQRTQELLLFRTWLPATTGQAVASCIAIMGLGIASVGLRTLHHVLDARRDWDARATAAARAGLATLGGAAGSGPLWWLPSRQEARHNAVSALLTGEARMGQVDAGSGLPACMEASAGWLGWTRALPAPTCSCPSPPLHG
jgi:hypothetical protein